VDLVVARIGRPHALRGEVTLDVRTDSPERRLVPGAVFTTDPAHVGPLTLATLRRDASTTYATFAEAPDRTAAEALRGVTLLAPPDPEPEPDAWYPHELVGLDVVLPDGTHAGTCDGVEHLPAQDALKVVEPDGTTALIPLVQALVPDIDLPNRRITVTPPGGLLTAHPLSGERRNP